MSQQKIFKPMRNELRTLVAAWKGAAYTRPHAADNRSWSYDRLAAHVCGAFDYTVIAGPYKGMRYFGPPGVPSIDRHPTTKILGTFEMEIHPWIETLVGRGFRQVVHIGAGEGYHAIGLAMRMPLARSIVFETLLSARKAMRDLAQLNGVCRRIRLDECCDVDKLAGLDLRESLIFSDCGGSELTLLDPARLPGLRTATIVVELHDFFDGRITPGIFDRFSATHFISLASAAPRDPSLHGELRMYSRDQARQALDENRHLEMCPHAWAMLVPYDS